MLRIEKAETMGMWSLPLRASRSIFLRVTFLLLLMVSCLLPAVLAQNAGGLKGKVRTQKGDGIPGASVTARKKGVDVKTVKADSKGNFVIDGLESGNYNVVFEARGHSSGVLYNILVEKKKIYDLGDRLILNTDQGTQVIVRGSIFYREGTSLMGAKVEIERINSDGTIRKLGSSYTNVSGEFTFRQPEGAAKLRVTAKFKGVSGTKEIEVDMAAIYRLAITLDISRTEK